MSGSLFYQDLHKNELRMKLCTPGRKPRRLLVSLLRKEFKEEKTLSTKKHFCQSLQLEKANIISLETNTLSIFAGLVDAVYFSVS
jgi:hypothetical protein